MFNIGDTAELSKQFSEDDITTFSNLSLDHNPIHLDEAYASETRFGKRIVHGMLSASLISAILGNILPGHGSIYMNQEISFKAPVYIGDTITAQVEITDINIEKSIVTLKTICKNQTGEMVIDGSAVLWAPHI